MSIHALPLELLHLILNHCPPESLCALSLTCSSLHYHAHPRLYADINLHKRFTSPALPNIRLLALALLHNPSVGAQIRSLRLRGPEHWTPSSSSVTSDVESLNLSLLASRGVQTGHGTFSSWNDALATSSREAFLVLLLSYLSSLTTLAFEDDPNVHFNVHHSFLGSWNPPFGTHPSLGSKPTSLFAHALTKLPSLGTVELGLCNEGVMLNHNAPIIRVLQSLPSLHTLKIALRQPPATNSSTYFPLPIPMHLTASNLTTLYLHDCALSERSTILVTTRFPNLQTLNLSFLRKALSPSERLAGRIPPDSYTWLDCTLLGEYLASSTHFANLQHLSISLTFTAFPGTGFTATNGGAFSDGRFGNPGSICFFGIKGSIGSLQHLTSLKTLSIPPPVLLGWHPDQAEPLDFLLPEALEELSFRGDLSHWDSYKWSTDSLRDVTGGLSREEGGIRFEMIDCGHVDEQ